MVAADAALYSGQNEEAAQVLDGKYVSIPNQRRTDHYAQTLARITVSRCRHRALQGMERWVGLGAIADTVIGIGHPLALQEA